MYFVYIKLSKPMGRRKISDEGRRCNYAALPLFVEGIAQLLKKLLSFWLCAFGSRLLELAQQLLLLARQAGRRLHDDGDILVAAAAPVDIRDALALQAERRAGLRALADRIADLAVERRHLDLRSAGCLRERDGHLAVDVLPLPREQRVAADADRDHQIAARAAVESGVALAAHAQRLEWFFTTSSVRGERFRYGKRISGNEERIAGTVGRVGRFDV